MVVNIRTVTDFFKLNNQSITMILSSEFMYCRVFFTIICYKNSTHRLEITNKKHTYVHISKYFMTCLSRECKILVFPDIFKFKNEFGL